MQSISLDAYTMLTRVSKRQKIQAGRTIVTISGHQFRNGTPHGNGITFIHRRDMQHNNKLGMASISVFVCSRHYVVILECVMMGFYAPHFHVSVC